MKIDHISLQNKSKLMIDYQKNKQSVMDFFEYHPYNHYKKRLEYLRSRQYQRADLVNVLIEMNKSWGATEKTIDNIKRLHDDRSVVVIGGQQAGLLTGPMYTLNKIISIIQFAKQQEEQLQVPVIPVFWIAGEDHDFEEINHIHLFDLPKLRKHQISQYMAQKYPISNVKLDQKLAKQWVDDVFYSFQETDVSKQLYESINECLIQSESYVDFFARLLFSMFADHGIVLIDSHNQQIRKLESNYFINLINNQENLASEMFLSAQKVKQAGYSLSLNIDVDDGHIFYHHQGERILLKRTNDGQWIGKQNEIILTTDELINVAKNQPHLLSNNVVTRPLMQEMLFPTLAFIGGWGEISYWSILKRAFHTMDLSMPPVVPRLSLSYVNKKAAKIMDTYSLSSEQVINKGVKGQRANWLAAKQSSPISLLADQIKDDIQEIHKPLRNIARDIDTNIGELADKNVFYLQKEIDFLVKKMTFALKKQYRKELNDFLTIELVLRPNGGLQERLWNPIQLMNVVNCNFIDKLINTPLDFENDHYVVFL